MIKLALKDIRLFFSDKRAMMMTFILPISLITLFAFAFGGAGRDKNRPREYSLPVSDLDNTEASRGAIEKLDAEKSLKTVTVNLEEARDAVKKGKEDCVLIFYKGFADSLEQGKTLPVELQYDEAREMQVGMLQQALFSTLAMLPYSGGNAQMMMSRKF